MNIEIKKNESIDELQIDGLKIIQKEKGFKFGMDAVLLAGYVQVKKGDKVVDLGTGSGIIPLILSVKTNASAIVGLEIQKEIADMAFRSVTMNNLGSKITIINGDLTEWKKHMRAESCSVVTANPPYMPNGGGLISPYDSKAIARHEIKCTLEDVISAAFGLLKFKGFMFMIHKPERLVDIFTVMRNNNLEPKAIRFVHSAQGKRPELVLIKALKGGNSQLTVQKPLYIYKKDGQHTEEIKGIYN